MEDNELGVYCREDTPENFERSLDFLKAVMRYNIKDTVFDNGETHRCIYFHAEDLMRELRFPMSFINDPAISGLTKMRWQEATLCGILDASVFTTEAKLLGDLNLIFSQTSVSAPNGSAKPLPPEVLRSFGFPGENGMRDVIYKGHKAAYILPEAVYPRILQYCLLKGKGRPQHLESFYAIVDFEDEKVLLASEEYREIFEHLLCEWDEDMPD